MSHLAFEGACGFAVHQLVHLWLNLLHEGVDNTTVPEVQNCARAAAEEAARSAASKQSRGWQIPDPQPEDFLPEPDLIILQLSTLKQLLLEAAAFGCMLWESEKAVQNIGYPLTMVHVASADVG